MKQMFEITVDIQKETNHTDIKFSQNSLNTSELNINIANGGKEFTLLDSDKIIVYFKKPDQKVVFQDKQIEVIDKAKGKINVLLTTQTLIQAGKVYGEISIEREEDGVKKRINTYDFSFEVRSSFSANESIESTNEFQVFDKILETGKVLKDVNVPALIESEKVATEAKEATVQLTNQIGILSGNITSQFAENQAQIDNLGSTKTSKHDVQEMIGSIADGTPVFASDVATMADKSRLYVNLADGFLYMYDGSKWTSTNIKYQSTGLAEGAAGKNLNRGTLTSNQALNDMTDSSWNGLWTIGSANTNPNLPSTPLIPGMLNVWSTGKGDAVQVLTWRSGGGTYEREYTGSAWRPWRRTDTIPSDTATRISSLETISGSGPFYRRPTLPDGTDLNSLRTNASNGLHLIGSTQNYPNRPEGVGTRIPGALIVFSTGSGDTYQRLFYRNKGGVFERYETGSGSFTPWNRLDAYNFDDMSSQLLNITDKAKRNEAQMALIQSQLTPKSTFEATSQFTTYSEGEAYLDWLARRYPSKVSVITLGSTRLGLPLRALRFGNPTKPTLYVMASQHGDEPMGREAAMIWARQLCESTTLGTLFTDACIVILPVVNADKINVTRLSSSNTDLNRNWLTRTTDEVKAASSIFSSHNVVLTIDAHEGGGIDFMEGLGPTANGISPEITSVANSLHTTLAESFSSAGEPWRDYAGSSETDNARNNIALTEHSVTYLFESPSLLESNMRHPSVTWRKDLYLLAYNTVLKHFHTNIGTYITAKESASKS